MSQTCFVFDSKVRFIFEIYGFQVNCLSLRILDLSVFTTRYDTNFLPRLPASTSIAYITESFYEPVRCSAEVVRKLFRWIGCVT